MMTPTGKAAIAAPSTQSSVECCMCGDHGLTDELFQCRICHFRSQHRYCSNLYPKAESYRVCNWCLGPDSREDGAPVVRTQQQNSSDSNSPRKGGAELEGDVKSGKRLRRGRIDDDRPQKPSPLHLQAVGGGRIKKERSPERILSPTTPNRRRIITRGELEEKLRRTRSEEISHVVPRQGFRNKVRRYKLLDEVSS
ncbi:hypothetical protein BT93_F0757 [Corymbia citriodora subsp. variegata]|nr:hypothetical protein BT93_F0757 [Corymbia citriodora subsp. variegata]